MSLADEIYNLAQQPTAEEVQYTPRTEFDGETGFIQTGGLESGQPPDFDAILREFGYDPTKVRIVGNPRVSRWQQRSRNRDTGEFDLHWLCSYRLSLAAVDGGESLDLEALIRKNRKRSGDGPEDGYWFVFQSGDQQIGKRSSGGSTEEIVDRYLASVEGAVKELKSSRRLGIGGVQLSFPGDCIEGNQSQHGRNLWLTQETVTEQTRIFRRLLLFTLDSFAPLVPRLYLDVVNGNHDEAQRKQNTYPGNGWATEQAITVSDLIRQNPVSYGHCEVRVPPQWQGYMTVPVGDSVVTVIHGHQWRAGKAMSWWAEQAINNLPPGAAQVLQNGHWHTWEVESTQQRTRIASPTLDCGSDWFRERHGATSRRGSLSYLLKSGEVSRLSVV